MTAVQTFDDEFNTLSLWNGSSGTWSTTYHFADPNGNGSSLPGNGEQEWYINANYAPTSAVKPWTVSNGVLTLSAQKVDPSIAQYLGYTQSGLPGMGSYQYTSGLIETDHSFTQTYGYFEMRAELPAGQGYWPAFWLLPADGSWPPELDVMEVLGNDPTKLYTTVHTNQTGTHTSSGAGTAVANTSTGYHTYAVDWEADKITWYFDNQQVYSVATPADMNKPMYMIANLAVGGYWPGDADASTPFPGQMNIDYIKAWNSNPYAASTVEASTGPGQAFAGAQNDALTGSSGDDTFTASPQGGETLTGGTGHDLYVFGAIPWVGDHVTDFFVGSDKLDLSALFKASGYAGTDPIADGYVKLVSDNAMGTWVIYDRDGPGTADQWGTSVVDLQNVSPYALTSANLFAAAPAPPAPPSPTPIVNVEPFSLPLSGAPTNTVSTGTRGTMTGTSRNDLIDGRGVYHAMAGAGGDDTYVVYNTADTVTERSGAGIDTVRSKAASFTLASNVENGQLVGASTQTLIGNGLDNDLTSNAYGSVLKGGGGKDVLHAGAGADTLTGGAGRDVFQFSVAPASAGHVTDFAPGTDVLDLRSLFAAAEYKGVNPIADGYLVLNEDGLGDTRVLFDRDGAGGASAPTLITTLDHVAPTALHGGTDWVFG
jgi:beta-glucanase (GH16 family)